MATTKTLSAKAQLTAAMETIAVLQAQLAAAPTVHAPDPVSAAPTAPATTGHTDCLGNKQFQRPILELVSCDADYRTDEEFNRGIQLMAHETTKRAMRWAMQRREFYVTLYEGAVAVSAPTYVAPVSGKWPANHDGFEFPTRSAGTWIAIY